MMCENTEKGSGLLMCDMCLKHLSTCSQLGAAYVSATTGAVVTALGLKSLATVMPVVQVNKQKQSNSDTEILIYMFICIFVQRFDASGLSVSLILTHLCSVSHQSSAGLSPLLLLLLLTVSTFPS